MSDKRPDKLLAEWFWIDRWTGSSAFELSLEARGLYREMLSQAWRRGARLPSDPEKIRRIVGASEKEWRRVWPEVSKYWQVVDEGAALVNETQLEVYAQAQASVETAAKRARAGADARWKHKHEPSSSNGASSSPSSSPSNADANAQASPEQSPLITDREVQHPPNPPRPGEGGRITRAEREWAEVVRRQHGCHHVPPCGDSYTCVGKLVGEKRKAERDGLDEAIQ